MAFLPPEIPLNIFQNSMRSGQMILYHLPRFITLRQTNIAMENGELEMYVLLKMVIFHCYVSLPEHVLSPGPC